MSLPPPVHLYLDPAPSLHKNLPLTINYSLSPEFPNSSQLAPASLEKHLQLSLLTKQKNCSLDSTASLCIAENFFLHLFSWKFVRFLKSGLWFMTSLLSSHSLIQPHSDLPLAKHSILYLARPLGGTSYLTPSIPPDILSSLASDTPLWGLLFSGPSTLHGNPDLTAGSSPSAWCSQDLCRGHVPSSLSSISVGGTHPSH